MTNTTNVPQVQFTLEGLVVPTEPDVLAGVQADYNAAFGGNLNPALNTPQGQLATSTTAVVSNANSTFAEFVNQVDPDTADGFMQDAIARIYFLTRVPGTPTAVQCTCSGLFGTVIPVGAQAQDTSGNIYLCQEQGTIGAGGTVSLPFACTVNGPTACPSGTLTVIYQAIPGWDSITNPADGVEGANVESRQQFEYRRQQSVALNSVGSLPSIYAAVFNVPGVIDCYVTDNDTGSTVNTGSTSFPIPARTLYVAATGGAAQDIGNAIWKNKNIGAGYCGNTTVTVTDPSGYSLPLPSYSVSFEIPAATPVNFAVQIQSSTSLPSNIVSLVQQAIIASFTGADGSVRARIGSQILASKYYAPVSLIGPEVSILSILISAGTGVSPTLNAVTMGIDQQPTIVASNISVTLV